MNAQREIGFQTSWAVGECIRVYLEVTEDTRYTTTIKLQQNASAGPDYLAPTMTVRLYHDARMAEVLTSQQISRLRPRYDYPNSKMHLPDEKFQVNRFLAEWLGHCWQLRLISSEM